MTTHDETIELPEGWRCTKLPHRGTKLSMGRTTSTVTFGHDQPDGSCHDEVEQMETAELLAWMGGTSPNVACRSTEASPARAKRLDRAHAATEIGFVVGLCVGALSLFATIGTGLDVLLGPGDDNSEQMLHGAIVALVLSAITMVASAVDMTWTMTRPVNETERAKVHRYDLHPVELGETASGLATVLVRRWCAGEDVDPREFSPEIHTARETEEMVRRVLGDDDATEADRATAREGLAAIERRTRHEQELHETHQRAEQLVAGERERVLDQFARADRQRERASELAAIQAGAAQIEAPATTTNHDTLQEAR